MTCDEYATPVEVASLADIECAESSGLAASRTNPGVWWTHNDAGGEPELFAFTLDGTWLGTWTISGAAFWDWEDIAAGPCPGTDGDCLYIGDTGDNGRIRTSVVVYVVEDPLIDTTATPPVTVEIPLLASAVATWPDEVRDSETLMVHPRSREVYLVSKEADGFSKIVKFPEGSFYSADADPVPVVLESVADFDLSTPAIGDTRTTGGDWEPAGDRVVIRSYGAAWEWRTDPCDPDAHWSLRPRGIDLRGEIHGEAIAYDLESNLVTSGEGLPLLIRQIDCTEPGPSSGPCDTGEEPVETDTSLPGEDVVNSEPDSAVPVETTGVDRALEAGGGSFFAGGCRGCVAVVWLPLLGLGRRRRLRLRFHRG